MLFRFAVRFFAVVTVFVAAALVVRADAVDDAIKAQMDKQHVPGLSLAVVRDGRIVKMQGYGRANVELNVPATPDTVYEIGSITKQFTATAVLMLVEASKIGLDDKITQHLTGLPDAWKDVTVRQLLTHTSGIKGYTEAPNFDKLMMQPATHEMVIQTAAALPIQFPPGEKWAYSNTGYYLLGLLIEKASGKPYGDFLRERIFAPLGMTSTQVNDPARVIPKRANGYNWEKDALRNAPAISMTWPFAAGVLVSTVADLAKWDAAQNRGRLLKKATWEQMWTPVTLNDKKTAPYGFGWSLDPVNGHKSIAHGGGIPGFVTYIARYPDDKLTVIVLTNSDSGDPGRIAQNVAGLYVPALAPIVLKAIADTEPAVTALVRDVNAKMAAGTLDQSLLTPAFWAQVSPNLKPFGEFLKSLGPLQSVALLERTEDAKAGTRTYRYRFVYENKTLLMRATLTGDNKIAGIQAQPE